MHITSWRLLFVVPLFVLLGTVECWGGRQGGCGLELCVRRLRVCGSPLAVCLVSLFVSVCRSCVSSSSVQRPPIPRWCPVRAWLFFTFLPNLQFSFRCIVGNQDTELTQNHSGTGRKAASRNSRGRCGGPPCPERHGCQSGVSRPSLKIKYS